VHLEVLDNVTFLQRPPMMTCAGIVLLGLCVPVPGMTESMVHQAGWNFTDDRPQSDDRFATVSMQWDKLFLAVTVGASRGRVTSVVINEKENHSAIDTEDWLKAHCQSTQSGWACSIGASRFVAERCVVGWALLPQNRLASDAGVFRPCEEPRRYFETR
jgi:hypothetical protein